MKRVLLEACGWTKEKLPLNMQIITPFARLIELQSYADNITMTQPSELECKRQQFFKAREEVDQMWLEYEEQNKGNPLSWVSPGTGHTQFRDPFTSLTYAYFSACYILLDLLAPTYAALTTETTTSLPFMPSLPAQRYHSTPSASSSSSNASPLCPSTISNTPETSPASATKDSLSPSPNRSQSFPSPSTTDHFALILSVSWYLRLRDTGFAYLRLHAPLFLVAMYAPTLEQRSVARMVFEDWKVGALRGIGWLAVSKLEQVRAKFEKSLVRRGTSFPYPSIGQDMSTTLSHGHFHGV